MRTDLDWWKVLGSGACRCATDFPLVQRDIGVGEFSAAIMTQLTIIECFIAIGTANLITALSGRSLTSPDTGTCYEYDSNSERERVF